MDRLNGSRSSCHVRAWQPQEVSVARPHSQTRQVPRRDKHCGYTSPAVWHNAVASTPRQTPACPFSRSLPVTTAGAGGANPFATHPVTVAQLVVPSGAQQCLRRQPPQVHLPSRRHCLQQGQQQRSPQVESHHEQQEVQPQLQPLGPGVAIFLAGSRFRITKPLGQGSFGIVWAAEDDFGASVAIKEIPCKSESELSRVAAEGSLLQLVEQELASAGLHAAAGHVPTLVASEVEQVSQKKWLLRLAMSLLEGVPLESFLDMRQKDAKLRVGHGGEVCHQFAEACRYAGHLLVQLAPILEAFSTRVYHRDITPRNILIQEQIGGDPVFSLVDFGLAVEATKWRAGEAGAGDLGGDGRYWPASAWYVFCYGTRALERDAWLQSEYRQCLDVHSLGITALRCLVEMLPLQLPEGDGPRMLGVDGAWQTLQTLRSAWRRYWSDARRCWQPVFDAFRGNGDFETLRATYIQAGVHHVISDDLCALRAALLAAQEACQGLPQESGLAGMPALFDGLLLMVQGGRPESQAVAPEERTVVQASRPDSYVALPEAHQLASRRSTDTGCCDLKVQRWSSMSTASPDSSPSSSSASSGSSSSSDRDLTTVPVRLQKQEADMTRSRFARAARA